MKSLTFETKNKKNTQQVQFKKWQVSISYWANPSLSNNYKPQKKYKNKQTNKLTNCLKTPERYEKQTQSGEKEGMTPGNSPVFMTLVFMNLFLKGELSCNHVEGYKFALLNETKNQKTELRQSQKLGCEVGDPGKERA